MSAYWRGRLLDLRWELYGVRSRWIRLGYHLGTGWRWLAGPGLVSLTRPTGPYPRWQEIRSTLPRQWLARKDYDRNAYLTWSHPGWWFMLRMDSRELRYRTYFWLGIIIGPEGGFYHDHRWCWPWQGRRPGWREPTRTIYTWPVYGAC